MVSRVKRVKPAYRQIAEAEAAKIEAGVYQFSVAYPSIPELAEEWGVSRQTVHEARKLLIRAGYLIAEHGRATWPARPPYRDITRMD